jgi:hypothetical protein
MTVPPLSATTTAALLAARQWESATAALSSVVAQLGDAAVRGDKASTTRLLSAVMSAYTLAVAAARGYSDTGSRPTDAMQSQWVAVLSAMDNAVKSARLVVSAQTLAPVVTMADTSGWRIPYTKIIVPWVALLGVAAVVAAGLYFSRKRR